MSQKQEEPEKKALYTFITPQKQSQLAHSLLLDPSWKLPPHMRPPGMHLSIPDSIYSIKTKLTLEGSGRVNVMDIPRTCGLLGPRELEITESWDVRGLLGVIARGEVKVVEVVGAFCKRAAITHQLTRCITEPLFHNAIERAKALDTHYQKTGTVVGPLHGLPVTVKDTFNIKDVDSTIGLATLAFHPSPENAPLINLLTSLGAVIIAKTNVPQTIAQLDSCNHLFGRTLNPLNHLLSAGGSSGGEGVMVAMRGCMVGFGTDIGGSIRVPAMCNGVYGFKPSVGRVPFGGQQDGQVRGKGRMALQAVAGPLGRSVEDLGVVMKEILPRAELFGEDCIPGRWESETFTSNQTGPENKTKFTVGILRSDGLVHPLPPITKLLDEVADILRDTPGIEVIDLPTPPALAKCQSLAGKLMGVDDGSNMVNLLNATGEPLTPWLVGRMKLKPGKSLTVTQLAELQAQRSALEREMMKMWTFSHSENGTVERRRIDAVILPVAPHPVPEIDRYNAVGYTSSFVLLDYPAGVIPVRKFKESDLELGKEMMDHVPVLGGWDRVNRELWNEKSVDRRVYLDSPLSIQVVTPKLHDYDLFRAMEIIDGAIRVQQTDKKKVSAKL